MRQIIKKHSNGKLNQKYYLNNRGLIHGLAIIYLEDGNLLCKPNYVNGNLYGLNNCYSYYNKGEIYKQEYYL